jgi:membrane-associated phospholipid phosphatase
MWAGMYVSLAILTPLLYLFWLVRHGRVTDLDVQLREQRMRPLLFTIACNGAAWVLLILGAAPSLMVVLAGVLWVQMSAIFAITLFWKISVHCAAAAVAATLIWSLTGTPLPLLIGVPIVAWSRVRLRRHTVPQTVGGALLGIAIFMAGLCLVYGR